MILTKLSLLNYKNIEAAELTFSDKLNCVIGANGMGKTNLLDSIYYLSFTRPNQYLHDSMVIRNGADLAIIDGLYRYAEGHQAGKEEQVYIGLRRNKSKILKRNKKEYPKLSDHVGLFPLVMIAPSDIDLIRGGSAERRAFMDQIICQESRQYLTAAQAYRRQLEQRNAMLKQDFGLDLQVLEVLDEQMASYAVQMLEQRLEWIERIRPIFLRNYQFISNSGEEVSLNYLPSLELREYTKESLKSAWQACFQRDRTLGYTTIGPHRDDLEMLLGDLLIRKVGSQGQNKTFMIALKFAQYSLLRQLHPHNTPILLLDDIFDKLDEQRVGRIVELVSGSDFGQIFMSDTNRNYLDQILRSMPDQADYSIYLAKDGHFEKC